MSASALPMGRGRPLPSVEDDACLQSGSSPPPRAIRLPSPADLTGVPLEEVPSIITQLAALTAALAPRLAVVVAAPTIQPTQPKWATAKEVAAAFSLRLDRVYELARTKRIPCHPIGRQLRFDLEEVRKALDAGRPIVAPVDPKRLRGYTRSRRQEAV